MTRFYERDDWKRRLKGAEDIQPLLLERGISLNLQSVEGAAVKDDPPTNLEMAAEMLRVAAEAKQ